MTKKHLAVQRRRVKLDKLKASYAASHRPQYAAISGNYQINKTFFGNRAAMAHFVNLRSFWY